MDKLKRAVALSGGGAVGAEQAGVLVELWDREVDFDIVAGGSVGAMNGGMVAMDKKDRVPQLWSTVKTSDVYKESSLIGCLLRLATGKMSLYDSSPLYELIKREFHLREVKKKFFIGVTSLHTGKYYSLSNRDFIGDTGFRKAIYASALMPVIWSPVDEIITTYDRIKEAVDGGLRNVTPLGDLLSEAPDVIYIISTHQRGGLVQQESKNFLALVKRVFLGLMLNEVINNDIDSLLEINALVLQANKKGFSLMSPNSGRTYKYFETVIITPDRYLGSPLDFSRSHIDECFSYGRELGKKVNII